MKNLDVKDIKKGDRFFEVVSGRLCQMTALEDAWGEKMNGKGSKRWSCRADGQFGTVTLMAVDNLEHYGPVLVKE